jgi:hypothetical protein
MAGSGGEGIRVPGTEDALDERRSQPRPAGKGTG